MTAASVHPADPRLAHWAELVEQLRLAGALVDRDLRLVWASVELARFLGSPREEDLGYGLHVPEAFRRDAWRQIATAETQDQFWRDFGPAFLDDALARDLTLDDLPAALRPLLGEAAPKPFTKPLATSFDYLEPGGDRDLPVMRVNLLAVPLRDAAGAFDPRQTRFPTEAHVAAAQAKGL